MQPGHCCLGNITRLHRSHTLAPRHGQHSGALVLLRVQRTALRCYSTRNERSHKVTMMSYNST